MGAETSKEKDKATEELPSQPAIKGKILPAKYNDIVKEAEYPSKGSLEDELYTGIFLGNKRKKYWVDKETGCNCFILYARDLSITWSEEPKYWSWTFVKDTDSNQEIYVAYGLNVCWLEVHGKLETSYLTPGTTYEIVFALMIKKEAHGWHAPVNLRIKHPSGSVQEHKEYLESKPRNEWIEVKVGETMASPEQAGGLMEISLYEYEDGQWKRGMVIKGIIIRPKK